jgi:hypothetical protein
LDQRHLTFEPLLPPTKTSNVFDLMIKHDDTDDKPLPRSVLSRIDTQGILGTIQKEKKAYNEMAAMVLSLDYLSRRDRVKKEISSDNDFPGWFEHILASLNMGNVVDELPSPSSLSEHDSTLFSARSTNSALARDIYDDLLTRGNTHVIPSK